MKPHQTLPEPVPQGIGSKPTTLFGRALAWFKSRYTERRTSGEDSPVEDGRPREVIRLTPRVRVESTPGSGCWLVQEREVEWDALKTAIVVCDMWDRHWCPSATARVAEMAPRMNEVLHAARKRGVLIIHCPSETMKFYKRHPGRKLARSTPKVKSPIPLRQAYEVDPQREPPLPVGHGEKGCDAPGSWKPLRVWSRQIETIDVLPGDAIADSHEALYLMRQRGLSNVVVSGVATDMCVLARPFGIRHLVYQGQNVLLMRDLTDAFCTPDQPPFVSHFRGTELTVEHIEKYWCPSITSTVFLGGRPFRFSGSEPRRHETQASIRPEAWRQPKSELSQG